MNLFPYQRVGVDWLKQETHRLLADDMGLGKTAQLITAAKELDCRRILIICPAVARFNWRHEFSIWWGDSPKVNLLISGRDHPSKQINIMSFDYLTEWKERLIQEWDLVIVDESHYLKNPDSKRTQAVFSKDGIFPHTKRLWLSSGTPAPNHPGELWPVLYSFGKTSLTYDGFVDRYCNSYHYQGRKCVTGVKKFMVDEIKRELSKVMLRRMKVDVLPDLPKVFYQDLVVEAGKIDPYKDEELLKEEMYPMVNGGYRSNLQKQTALVDEALEKYKNFDDQVAAMMALSNSISTLRRFTGMQKIEAVAEIIKEELKNNAYRKIVIFAVHRAVIQGLQEALKEFHPVAIYGGTPAEKRHRYVTFFQTKFDHRVFIGNIQAAGTNLTLTAADQLMMVECSWVPGENKQAIDRCVRIGQEKPVTVRFVSLNDSIDSKITSTWKRKAQELSTLYGDKQNPLTSDDPTDTDYKNKLSYLLS